MPYLVACLLCRDAPYTLSAYFPQKLLVQECTRICRGISKDFMECIIIIITTHEHVDSIRAFHLSLFRWSGVGLVYSDGC